MDKGKRNIIFIIGPPASGKGTLCGHLIKEFDNLVHVSVGDLLRASRQLDPKLNDMMAKGQLLPVSVVGGLIVSHINANYDESKTVLIDGFPRSKDNYDYFCNEMAQTFNLVGVIVVECPNDIILDRAVKRGQCSGRTDDTIETCQHRLNVYYTETEPIIDLFDTKLIKKVSGTSNDRSEICTQISQMLRLYSQ